MRLLIGDKHFTFTCVRPCIDTARASGTPSQRREHPSVGSLVKCGGFILFLFIFFLRLLCVRREQGSVFSHMTSSIQRDAFERFVCAWGGGRRERGAARALTERRHALSGSLCSRSPQLFGWGAFPSDRSLLVRARLRRLVLH